MASSFAGPVYRAPINVTGAGQIVAAVASKKIRVVAVWLISAGTADVKFQSGATSPETDLTGDAPLVANVGFVLPFNEVGWFDTLVGAPLRLDVSASVAVGGSVVYTLV